MSSVENSDVKESGMRRENNKKNRRKKGKEKKAQAEQSEQEEDVEMDQKRILAREYRRADDQSHANPHSSIRFLQPLISPV